MVSKVGGYVADSDPPVFIARDKFIHDSVMGDFVFAVLSVLPGDRFSLVM